MTDHINQNFQGFLSEVIKDGINMKILYQATGLQFHEFNQKHRDDSFTIEEKNTIYTTVKNWRKQS